MCSGILASGPDGSESSRLPTRYIIALHLGPGIVFSAFLLVLSGWFTRHGLTAYLAELIAVPTCLMPMLLGIVLIWSRRSGGTRSIIAEITYRKRGAVGDYVLWPILLFLCWALISLVVAPLSGVLEGRLYSWFPAQLHTQAMIDGVASSHPGQRQATFVLAVLLSGLLAPLVEEAYFRGFLLPRMSHLRWKAPVVNTFLFGLYHFFSPWSLPVIFVAFLPVVFVVQARENFRISLVVHAMFNLMGVLTLFLRLAQVGLTAGAGGEVVQGSNLAAEAIAAGQGEGLQPLLDLLPPARLTAPKPPTDSGPMRLRSRLPWSGNAEAAVFVGEESCAVCRPTPHDMIEQGEEEVASALPFYSNLLPAGFDGASSHGRTHVKEAPRNPGAVQYFAELPLLWIALRP